MIWETISRNFPLAQVNGFDRSRIPSFREFCEDKDQWQRRPADEFPVERACPECRGQDAVAFEAAVKADSEGPDRT